MRLKNRRWARSTAWMLAILCLQGLGSMASGANAAAQAIKAEVDKPLPKPGEKVPLGPGHYFIYGFDKPPRLGTSIMRVEIFSSNGNRDTTFVVKGDADMPSMRGSHTTANKQFSISAKGVYLLPVQLVMPGDWELNFTFEKDGKTVLRGVYSFQL